MADQEVIKHVKKTHKILTNKEHSLSQKIGEFILEIIIIVFAVSLSIWLHEWSEHRHQQKEVKEFLADVEREISNTIKEKLPEISDLSATTKKIKNITDPDQITQTITNSKIYFSGSSIFEGFKSSGKIAFIEDNNLRSAILSYYQEILPAVNTAEENLRESEKKMLYEINSHPKSFTGTQLYRYLYGSYALHVKQYSILSSISIEKGKDIVNQIKKLEK